MTESIQAARTVKKRAITLDNGGTELRYMSNTDNREVHVIDGNISIINPTEFRVKESVGELDIIHVLEAPEEVFKNMYATERGYYMYSGEDVKFTSQTKKADTTAWYQKSIIAIARDAMGSLLRAKALNSTETLNGEFEYITVPLIPLYEHSGSTDFVSKLKTRLAGNYEVAFPVLGKDAKVKFTLAADKMGVLPEGAVVITSLRGEIQPHDYTLVIDMGNGTTDRAVFQGLKLLGSAVTPSTFAGGTLLKLISTEISKTGMSANNDLAVQALTTYEVNISKHKIDITEGIDSAKRKFISSYIKDEILTVIELSGIQAANITRVVAIGGVLGTVNPITKEKDLLNMIMDECNLVNAELKVFEGNPRHVNVQKAADFCDALAKKFGYELNTVPMPEKKVEENATPSGSSQEDIQKAQTEATAGLQAAAPTSEGV